MWHTFPTCAAVSDGNTGDYTLSGSTGSTSTSVESNTHGTDSVLFTLTCKTLTCVDCNTNGRGANELVNQR